MHKRNPTYEDLAPDVVSEVVKINDLLSRKISGIENDITDIKQRIDAVENDLCSINSLKKSSWKEKIIWILRH